MAGMENASLSPLTISDTSDSASLRPPPAPLTAPIRSASFAAMQDSTLGSSGRVSRSASTTKLFQIAKESGYKSKSKSYDADADLRADVETCRQALELFLASRMHEGESLLKESDPKMERLYIATGYGLIQSVKAFMSFEDKDLATAIELARSGSALAHKHRKPLSLTSRVTGLVTGSTSSVTFYKSMTPTQRHAELVYGECLAQKAILGIVYSGDWLQFIKEAINMRACIGLFRSMHAYLEAVDAEADAAQAKRDGSGKSGLGTPQPVSGSITPNDSSELGIDTKAPKTPKFSATVAERLDEDFRSGVYLGMGLVHLILSLLPSRVMPILELFGYKGDRTVALRMLEKAGGWGVLRERLQNSGDSGDMYNGGVVEPGISRQDEGLRRSLCDMVLLMFHLVFSTITYHEIDVPFASQILGYNAVRYPRGIFFLFGQGRLALYKGDPMAAIKFYMTGMEVVGGRDALRGLEGVGFPTSKQLANQIQHADDLSNNEEEDNAEFKSLQGLALWELAVARTALWDIRGSVGCWRRLREEAGWSKAVYAYGLAAGLYQIGEEGPLPSSMAAAITSPPADISETPLEISDDSPQLQERVVVESGVANNVEQSELEEAATVLETVPGLMQRIAGKSIPFEKFTTRRARKFKAQGNRLLLPTLELAYVLLALPRAPRKTIFEEILPTTDAALEILKCFEGHESEYCGVGRAGWEKAAEISNRQKRTVTRDDIGEKASVTISSGIAEKGKEAVADTGYWDDYCLAQFLRGVCLRYIAYPDSFVTVTEPNPMPDAAKQAKEAFEFVLEHGTRIMYDHHIVYWTHYEFGKLEARSGDKDEARRHIELVLSGKLLEVNWNGRKGKYDFSREPARRFGYRNADSIRLGKYSLENALNVRAHAALEGLEQDQLL